VGAYGLKSQAGALPFVARWNGTAWTAHTAPLPAGATGGFLNGVSCTSPSRCTAVGGFDNAAGTAVPPFAVRWDGTTWTLQAVNAPRRGRPWRSVVHLGHVVHCRRIPVQHPTGRALGRDKLDGSAHPRAEERDRDLRDPARGVLPVGHLLHRGRVLQPGTAAGRPRVAGPQRGAGRRRHRLPAPCERLVPLNATGGA